MLISTQITLIHNYQYITTHLGHRRLAVRNSHLHDLKSTTQYSLSAPPNTSTTVNHASPQFTPPGQWSLRSKAVYWLMYVAALVLCHVMTLTINSLFVNQHIRTVFILAQPQQQVVRQDHIWRSDARPEQFDFRQQLGLLQIRGRVLGLY